MATRSVAKYLRLERALQQAIVEHDRSAVTSVLESDFEMRSPASRDMRSQEDWLKDEFRKSSQTGRVRDLLVFEMDDVAVVSFLLETQGNKHGKQKALTYFIVDVWRQSTDKLQVRYVDTPANPPPVQNRPDGRE
jgi:hypothetical protein